MKHTRHARRTKKTKGGAPLPLAYFGAAPQIGMPVAEGKDLLTHSGSVIRPRMEGGKRRAKKTKKQRGGFIPTVMEGFCMAASKYIIPIALFAGYKFMTRTQKKR